MNSLERLIGILDLFEDDDAALTAEQMHVLLGYSRSTLYRYLKVLTDSGLLSSFHSAGYSLGPRVAELDYRMRMRDPLIAAAKPVMLGLTKEFACIALLCRRYKDKVLCVHQEASTDAFTSNYERGRARSLTRGSASRVILANLAAPQIRKLYERYSAEFASAGSGRTLAEVRSTMRRIRDRGFEVASEELTPGVTGIGVAIFDSRALVIGSINLTIGQVGMSESHINYIASRVVAGVETISQVINA